MRNATPLTAYYVPATARNNDYNTSGDPERYRLPASSAVFTNRIALIGLG